MGIKVADWITTEELQDRADMHNIKTLPSGSFVKPISESYLPQHIKDSGDFKWWFNRQYDVYCYTSLGIIRIQKAKLRQV